MIKGLPIIGLLKDSRFSALFLIAAGGLFYMNYYLMAHLPGQRDLMCVIGGALTLPNIFTAVLMSVLAGFVVIGFTETLISRKSASVKVGSSSLIGLLAGGLTSFCTLCTLPVISLFGLSIGLGFFTDYAALFRGISLILLGAAFYLVNRDLLRACSYCKY